MYYGKMVFFFGLRLIIPKKLQAECENINDTLVDHCNKKLHTYFRFCPVLHLVPPLVIQCGVLLYVLAPAVKYC